MRFQMSAHWLRIIALALVTLVAAGCGTGDGEESVTGSNPAANPNELRLVFRDDFGGSSSSPRGAGVAATSPPAPLPPGDWVVETGYGQNGWGNDEWQRYTNSMDNVFIADGNLALRAKCATPPACGKRDDSITSGKVITRDRLNVRYGKIRARIKMPSGGGMWPAFWTLGSDIDAKPWTKARPWPDAGEIDIVEMHYFYSDIFTTHFSTHWSGPRYTPATRPVCASGVPSSLYPDEEENCRTANKTFDTPLTDDYHIFELDWNENRIVGKIDGITYFEQAIDAGTMEEFLKDHYLILNVAVGGTLGGPLGPWMTAADWADPDQTDMLVDWVEVWEYVPSTSATLIDESGNNLRYNKIVNSVEIGGASVGIDDESTAVPALVGSSVLELKYSTSVSPKGGAPARFSGAFFEFNNVNLSSYDTVTFSIDSSRFPGFYDIGIEFTDSLFNRVTVRTGDYTPVATSGRWRTYEIPLADFAGVDVNDILAIGFTNPNAAPNEVIEIGYVGANTLAGLSFGDPNDKSINLDLSALAGGTLEFDALVTEAGSAPWRIKFESQFAAAEVPLTDSDEGVAPEVGKWQHYTFQLGTTLGAVDLSTVKYLTIFTSFVGSSGRIQLDNIVFKPAAGSGSADVTAFGEELADQWTLWDCCSGGGTQIAEVSLIQSALIAGTLYVDDIVFSAGECTAVPSVEFDADWYNPTTSVAQVSVSDACRANKLVKVQVDNLVNGDTIFLDVDLDSAGNGIRIFGLIDRLSVCLSSDEKSYIALPGSSTAPTLEATYGTASDLAGVDFGAPGTSLEGERLFFYATDPEQELAVIPDAPIPNSFNYSPFSSGSTLNGSFADSSFNPSFQVRSGPGYGAQVAQIALINIRTGFAANAGTFHFKFKNVGSPNDAVKVEFGILGGPANAVVVDLSDTSRSTPLGDDWYQVTIPMADFPNTANYNFFAITSADPAPPASDPSFYFLVTDINLQESIEVAPAECADTIGAPDPNELTTNGDFEFGDLSSWIVDPVGGTGTAEVDGTENNSARGAWSAKLMADEFSGAPLIVKQANMGIGRVSAGDTIDVSFDVKGSVTPGCAVNAEIISEGTGGGRSSFLDPPVAASQADWTNYSFSGPVLGDVAGGVTLQFVAACGVVPGALVDVNIDNVSVIYSVGNPPQPACPGGVGRTTDPIGFCEDYEMADAAVGQPIADLVTYVEGWDAANTSFIYAYGPFGATNNPGEKSEIFSGEQGAAQGMQSLRLLSDYSNADHVNNSNTIRTFNFYEWSNLGPSDTGTYTLTFDAKASAIDGIAPPSTAIAFFKTLDPNAGFAETSFTPLDLSGVGDTWATYTLAVDLDGTALQGNILQVGFRNSARENNPSAILFDNVSLVLGATNLANDGDFENGDLSAAWIVDPGGSTGTATADNTENNGGSFSANLMLMADDAVGTALNVKQVNMGIGTVMPGDTIDVSFDIKGTITPGCAVNSEIISEGAGGGRSSFLDPAITADQADWTNYGYSGAVLGDVAGGVTLQFVIGCGPVSGAFADVNIDNVSVTIQ